MVTPEAHTLYCDASGKEKDSLFCVGGALSTVELWCTFNERWQKALDDEGLPYFHMAEFAHSTGVFKIGWKDAELRRRHLVSALADIILDCVQFWVGVCVFRRAYDKANKVYQLDEHFRRYTICGLASVQIALKWRRVHRLDDLPIRYVFEKGDDHWGQLSDRIKADTGQAPIPEPKRTNPLQVADFAAYEVRKAYLGLDSELSKVFEGFRKSFLAIGQGNQVWGELEEHAIRVEMNLHQIPKR